MDVQAGPYEYWPFSTSHRAAIKGKFNVNFAILNFAISNLMAKKPAEKTQTLPTFNPKDGRSKPLLGIIFLGLAILILVSVWDYAPEQSSRITTERGGENLVGRFGAEFGFYSFLTFGIGTWLIPGYLLWIGYMYFFALSHKLRISKILVLLLCLVSASALTTMLQVKAIRTEIDSDFYPAGYGGFVGDWVYDDVLRNLLGVFGGTFVLAAVFIIGSVAMFHDNIGRIGLKVKWEKWKMDRAAKAGKGKAAGKPKFSLFLTKLIPSIKLLENLKPTRSSPRKATNIPIPTKTTGDLDDILDNVEPSISTDHPTQPPRSDSTTSPTTSEPPSHSESSQPFPSKSLKIIASEQTKKSQSSFPVKKGDYVMPPLSILQTIEPISQDPSLEDHEGTAEALFQTLDEFGVKVTMGEVHTGPVITRFDIHPAAGVRVEKIVNLDKNLAMGLKATSVRILAPVPGKGCVGIEVPNRYPTTVSVREILESADWIDGEAAIPIALGREVSGRPLIADLNKMPHLLIAGATGSGKTICINAVITSLIYHFSPEDLRFVMVDPKIVEMQIFNDIPHMLIPVVTDPKKVPGALRYLLTEMDKRYKIFAKSGVRNIAGFNAIRTTRSKGEEKAAEEKEFEADLSPEERAAVSTIEVPRDEEIEIPDRLPYIVCIIDELADLMMVAPAEIETCVARLAQLARAAGIHLVIATQRPSVNVITGVIKANLPSRIAFKVASKVDSRTILDAMGADHLIGRGDLLFLPPESSVLIRAQGAFVSDEEIKKLVEYLKQEGTPNYDEQFQHSVETGEVPEEGEDFENGDDDDLLPDAIEVLKSSKRASTSMLQRRLRIGYNRAARIMEMLEMRGVVGPENGAQPREILKDLDNL